MLIPAGQNLPVKSTFERPPFQYDSTGDDAIAKIGSAAVKRIAVFGSSTAISGSKPYRMALELGEAVAGRGWSMMSGGYAGTMEALATGCSRAGVPCVGIAVREFDGIKTPNTCQTEVIFEDELFGRTRRLVRTADAVVVLDGNVGTMFELMGVWALLQCDLLRHDMPVVVAGPKMQEFVKYVAGHIGDGGAAEVGRFKFCAAVHDIIRFLDETLT